MNTMTPSAMTDGQIDKAVDQYRALLRKHRSELGSEFVQHILGQPEYVAEQAMVLRRRVEATSNLVIRHTIVNRDRSPEQVFAATGRKQYLDQDVVNTVPRGKGTEVDVIFFKVGRRLSDLDLEKEYELRGLIPVDPCSQAAVNEADPAFADSHPNGTHWQDTDGNWCYAVFDRWSDGRGGYVSRNDNDWSSGWWFAGLRKVA